jgi:Glycosyl transferase family 2
VADRLTVLIAARDEERRIGATVAALRLAFPDAEVIVADDGSRDGTAAAAAAAGAVVVGLAARGKGQALSAAERVAPPGRLLLMDADLSGDLGPLLRSEADLAIAAFSRRSGGGFGLAKRTGRALVRLRSGFDAREPLSGQRALSPAAREACFPLAPGFGCEVRMTIDAVRAGLSVEEPELELEHRATGRDLAGFAHRGRQLLDALVATGPLRVNYRGQRLPLLGWLVALDGPAVAAVAGLGLADDLWSGPERGFRAHVRAGRTTGVLKLVGIPAVALATTRSLSGALLVGLSANALNQLDTRPGRALKSYLLARAVLGGRPRRADGLAVLLLPYDLREMGMLGDAGSNALGAVLGFESVRRITGARRWTVIGALATLTILGERYSLGASIERSRVLGPLDRLGRPRL